MDRRDDGREQVERDRNPEDEIQRQSRKARRAAEARRGELSKKASETKHSAVERESRKPELKEQPENEARGERRLQPREAAGLRRQRYEHYARTLEATSAPADARDILDRVKGLPENQREEFLKHSPERFRLQPHEIASFRTEAKREVDRGAASAYAEFTRLVAEKKIRPGEPSDLLLDPTWIADPDKAKMNRNLADDHYWHSHGNSPEVYRSFAEKYPEIRREIDSGKSLDTLRDHGVLRDATRFWYPSEHDKIEVHKYKRAWYPERGHHRIALAQVYNLGPVPVRVTEWT